MKKENFNLKMKIFFLEERLANGDQNSNVDLINANAELKVIKYLSCHLQISINGHFLIAFKMIYIFFPRYKMGV